MLDLQILTVFIPAVFVASITPSICMTLALSSGMKVGVFRSLWMIGGELFGLSLVFIASGLGMSAFVLQYPTAFFLFKIVGGSYIIYLGIKSCLSKTTLKLNKVAVNYSNRQLIIQGFMASFFHPKAWLFLLAFIPSFIKPTVALLPQIIVLLCITLVIEFNSLLLYTLGGKTLSKMLQNKNKVQLINLLTGLILIVVGIWLIVI